MTPKRETKLNLAFSLELTVLWTFTVSLCSPCNACLPCVSLPPASALQTAQDVSFNNVLALLVELSARCIQPDAEEPPAEMDRKSVTLQGRYLLSKEELSALG